MLDKLSMLVVDDHLIVSSGIQLLLHSQKMEVDLQSCIDGKDCLIKLSNQEFDLIVMDINLPDTDTYQLVEMILKRYPDQKILIYTMSSETMYATKFMDLGATAYVSKQASNDEFIKAVQTVLNIEIFTSNHLENRDKKNRIKYNGIKSTKDINEKESNVDDKIDSIFLVKDRGIYRKIHLDDVIYFKLEGKYAKIICKNGTYSLRTSMNNLEDRICRGFIRVHGTVLVNESQIHSINPKEQEIYLNTGETIPLSRHYKKNILENIVFV